MRAPLDPLSEVVDDKRRWNAEWYGWLTELVQPVIVKVAELPSVSTNPTIPPAADGDRAFVTDATSTTFGTVVVGGGANRVPVYFLAGSWRIG